jgi:hypothetical protein
MAPSGSEQDMEKIRWKFNCLNGAKLIIINTLIYQPAFLRTMSKTHHRLIQLKDALS